MNRISNGHPLILVLSLILVLVLAGSGIAAAAVLSPNIPFTTVSPQIDGRLDADLAGLPSRSFTAVTRLPAGNRLVPVTWRMAYGTDFLYLYIEMEADSFVCRDRAYQNGDGFFMVLNRARPNNEISDNQFVLGFCPTGQPGTPYRRFVWKRNTEWPFTPLSDRTGFAMAATGGRVGFELRLAWADVYPLHPWLEADGIGFNLFFVKALDETGRNIYTLAAPGGEARNDMDRYLRLTFDPPAADTARQVYLTLDRNHGDPGRPLQARIAVFSPGAGDDVITVAAMSGEQERLAIYRLTGTVPSGLSVTTRTFTPADLIPGGYVLRWNSRTSSSRGEVALTILPAFSADTARTALDAVADRISAGSITSLRFRIEDIVQALEALPAWATAASLRERILRFNELLESAGRGDDVLARQTGYVRRAYRSADDGRLWPYTVKIPANFDPKRKYPVILFLHGSDQDDRALTGFTGLGGDEFIQVAPHGRDPQNCYSTAAAQEDIRDALKDAARNYPLDTSRVILAGFSMGGYGVYRTCLENPGHFRALAVFSGHPDLARHYLGDDTQPNFLDEKNLTVFKGMDIAIFHGRKDRNCPFELTDELAGKLKAAGARVLYRVDPAVGHSPPQDPAIMAEYRAWLKRMITPRP